MKPSDQLELRMLWERIREIEGDVIRLPDGWYDTEDQYRIDKRARGGIKLSVGREFIEERK